jgi:transposase
MFIRTIKNSSGQRYHQVVESYRNEEGQVRQRILLSLGRVEDGKGEQLLQALTKNKKNFEALDLAKDVSVEKTYIFGPLLLVSTIFEKLKFKDLLGKIQSAHPKLEIDLIKVVFTLISSRFVEPCSKLKTFEHWQQQFFSRMLMDEINLHHFYRTIDLLSDCKDEIEQSLYWRDRDLFNQTSDIVLYDLTTLRFESTDDESGELRKFGFSKEKRSDCTQVVFGLLLGTDGVPIGFEVYPGNTFEGSTIEGIVSKIKNKFNIRRLIFVADRGLFSSKNLALLRKDGGEFIVGHKLGSLNKDRKEEVYDINKFTWIIKNELAIYELKTPDGDRLLVSWSLSRAERDKKTRDDILTKIKKKLASNKTTTKKFISNSNYQKFVKGFDQGTPTLNEAAIFEAEKKDGFFGIVTNVTNLTTSEIVLNYKELWKIEDSFGEIKGTMQARPMFHWTDKRILGHLTLCFMAYYCEAIITKALREKNINLKTSATKKKMIATRPLTVVEALIELREVRVIPVQVRDQTVWVRTDITGNALAILKAIGSRIPPKVLEITNSIKL